MYMYNPDPTAFCTMSTAALHAWTHLPVAGQGPPIGIAVEAVAAVYVL